MFLKKTCAGLTTLLCSLGFSVQVFEEQTSYATSVRYWRTSTTDSMHSTSASISHWKQKGHSFRSALFPSFSHRNCIRAFKFELSCIESIVKPKNLQVLYIGTVRVKVVHVINFFPENKTRIDFDVLRISLFTQRYLYV